jgi:cyclopropane fatty-acyl-phospholipid synthase-like methyltransferase
MGNEFWFHGDKLVLQSGGSAREAAETMLNRLAEHAQISARSRVFEFGSGMGGAAVYLSAKTGASVVGVSSTNDHNRHARNLAARRKTRGNTSFLTVGDEDYKTLEAWPTGAFDAMLFMESVCHLPEKAKFFAAAHRIIKPGGRLVGLDWVQRPYGRRQTTQQIAPIIEPVCRLYRLAPPLGTLKSYAETMSHAGFDVIHAADEYEGELCLGNTEPAETWNSYDGPSKDVHTAAKSALDTARTEGVFSVAVWAAVRS